MTGNFQQKDSGFFTYPAGGWRMAMFKWPVQLWRLGLAPIIGHQLMLITHTGRKSGLSRLTMVEYYKMDRKKFIVSGFGSRAQWYRNIDADPYITIQTADGVESVRAERVTDGETLLRLLDGVKRREGLLLNMYLEALDVSPDREDILIKKDRFYWLTFEPTDEPTPAPMPADLVWIWPLVATGLLAWLWRWKKRRI